MLKLRVGQVKEYIKMAYGQKKPIFLHGAPGIGKSSVVRQAAEELKQELGVDEFFVRDVRLSQLDPTDLGGLPVPKDGSMARVYPNWWPTGNEYGILCFDELNKGTPTSQAAAYQLILDHVMGDQPLSPNVLIIAAGNRSSDNVTVYDMDSALQNRFPLHIEVQAPTKEELEGYFTKIGKKNLQVFGFWDFSTKSIWDYDEKAADPAWASPRSWEFLVDMLATVKDKPKSEREQLIRNLSYGCIGDVVGRKFTTYIKLNEKVDINEILNNPKKFHEIEEPDVRHSVITEIAERFSNNKSLLPKCVEFVYETSSLPEYVMLSLTMFSKANSNFAEHVVKDKRGEELAKHMENFVW